MSESPLDSTVSLFSSVRSANTSTHLTVRDVLLLIKNGHYAAEIARLRQLRATQGDAAYNTAKKTLPGVTFAGKFQHRANHDLHIASGILIADFDHLGEQLQAVRGAVEADPRVVAVFDSPSADGFKALVHIPRMTSDSEYKAYWLALERELKTRLGVNIDATGKDICRLCLVSHDANLFMREDAERFTEPNREPERENTPIPIPPDTSDAFRNSVRRNRIKVARDAIRQAQKGSRHYTRLTMGRMLGGYIPSRYFDSKDEVIALIESDVRANSDDPDDAMKTIHDAVSFGMQEPLYPGEPIQRRVPRPAKQNNPSEALFGSADSLKNDEEKPPGAPESVSDSESLPYSDYTNSLELVRKHGTDLRYCYLWKKWLVWTGTHWQIDASGAVMRMAKDTIKRLARRIEGLGDDEARALLKHIKRSFSAASLQAMIICAQSEEGIPVQPDDLDTDPWLLNCLNGTLDLRIGTLRSHNRADLITRCISTPYDPDAACPIWEGFLWRIMGGTVTPDSPDDSVGTLEARQEADNRVRDLIGFMQKASGYSLTGDTREECLFLLYGTGQNGKSKFIGALHDLLEEYSQSTHSKTFMVNERSDGIPNDLARMRGARFVSAVELGKNRRLNEELVKRATGRDPISARFLYGEFFDFLPQFKLFLATNHLPKITSIDKAMWRRLYQIPFTVTIADEEKDEQLGEKLRAELPGILAWAVKGCLAWQEHGLQPPQAIMQATEDYKSDMDTIGRFIDDCCIILESVQVKASQLYKAYKDWCESTGEHWETQTTFGNYLQNKGFKDRRSNGIWRLGIGLRDDA